MTAAVAIKIARGVAKGARIVWRYVNIREIYRAKRERKEKEAGDVQS